MANIDTPQFRNGIVSELSEMSLVTRQRGTLTAVTLALFGIQLGVSPGRWRCRTWRDHSR